GRPGGGGFQPPNRQNNQQRQQFQQGNQFGRQGGGNLNAFTQDTEGVYGTPSDGMIDYIKLNDVTLKEALDAVLRPLKLDYSIQPGFIWISSPDIIRRES